MKNQKQEDKILVLIRKVDAEYKVNPIYSAFTIQLGFPFVLFMTLYVLFVLYIGQIKNEIGTIVSLLIHSVFCFNLLLLCIYRQN